MDGFGDYRAAARAGIEAAGCEPVLVEDNTSLDASPRNACLDGIASCGAVAGERGGWRAPSGKLVVEEEYEHAVGRSIPTVVFIQDGVERDGDAEGLAARLSEYVDGRFRRSFTGPDDLAREVEAAVRTVARARRSAGMNRRRMNSLLAEPTDFGHEVVLRVVVAPGRQDETVAPIEQLDSEEFRYDFVRIGTDREVGLFDQNAQRRVDRGRNSLVVHQGDRHGGSGAPGQQKPWARTPQQRCPRNSRSTWGGRPGRVGRASARARKVSRCSSRVAWSTPKAMSRARYSSPLASATPAIHGGTAGAASGHTRAARPARLRAPGCAHPVGRHRAR
jgi:hypothetical protein